MPRYLAPLVGVALVLAIIAGPASFAVYRQNHDLRNFHEVREGVLYRGGQPTLAGLKRVVAERRIRCVVSLRDAVAPGKPMPDLDEEAFCRREEVNFVRLPPRHWEGQDGKMPPPVEENVRTFLEVMNDPRNRPVLVHCFAGIHRTGAYCAIYRMEFEHWSNERAIAEMRACGYTTLDDEWDILGYLEQYRPGRRGPLGLKPKDRAALFPCD